MALLMSYDDLAGIYIMTAPNVMLGIQEFNRALNRISNREGFGSLNQRLNKHSIPQRSGRALFSALLPEDFQFMNGNVVIINGVLVQGQISKPRLIMIIKELSRQYNPNRVKDFQNDLHAVSSELMSPIMGF